MKTFSLLLLFLIFTLVSFSQKVTGTSNSIRMTIEPEYEFTLPPDMYVDMKFEDDNGNGIIESSEKANLTLIITNKGAGPAQGLRVNLSSDITDAYFNISEEIKINTIAPGESQTVVMPMEAGFKVESNKHNIQINVTEHFGYDMDPATLIVNTLEYQKPDLTYIGMDIYDQGEGTMAIKADGQLQAGEMVKIKVIFQNIGKNVAKDVNYKFESKDPNIRIIDGTGTIGDMAIGEVQEIFITVSPNKRVTTEETLPIKMTISEKVGQGSIYNQDFPLALNQIPQKSEVVEVEADFAKMEQQVARFEYKSDKYTSNISAKNINAIPVTKSKRPDAIAVVIGVEEYENIPNAPYAAKDAEIMAKYFSDVMGIENVITHVNDEVSGFFFMQIFDEKTGKLVKTVNKGETEVYIYYSGHGIPEKDGNDVYLFPSDGNLEMLDMQGYSLNKLYKNLEALEAKNVTVILDACFTGSSRVSEKFIAENVSNTKGVILKPREVQPWQNNENFRVFTSSKDDQTSLGFDASGTGLFTYYLAIGLQGEADLNNDKVITAAELNQYVTENVSETSVKIRGQQTPQFFGNDEFNLVEF